MKLDEHALGRLQDWVARPQTGDVLNGRFELRQRIGEGGMGVVYAAHDRLDDRVVAVKIATGGGDHDTARFDREVHALEELSHPAVVGYIAHGVHEGARYIVMERLEGCSLAERLRLGPLSIRDTVELGARIGSALDEAHALGVVHRDLKPANIFLAGDLEGSRTTGAYLLDFGLARFAPATTLTAPGSLVGTPDYMAPERVRDDAASATISGDVFSLGCVLFECLLGRPPFQAETTRALLARVLLEMAPLVRRERPEVPLSLEALVEQMLAKEPSERPLPAEVVRALEEIRAALPETERRQIVPGLSEGDVVAGKYRVEQRLGEGGMGVVISARHLELGTPFAIKLLRAKDSDKNRFLREAQAASQIESEHVARVLDVGRLENGRPFIVMEHLRGSDLSQRLAEVGRLPLAIAVAYILQACAALAETHALGIVHRDIKPSNLFLVRRRDGSEIVKVLDFGISKLTRSLGEASLSRTATAESTVMGSVAYMAPELLQSSARADARSDIWSLGVVLFELVTGTKPFDGDSAVAVAARIAASPPNALRTVVPDAPRALEAVIERCLAKDPDARFPNIAALVGALSSLDVPPASSPKRRGTVWLAAGVSVVATAIVLTLAVERRTATATSPVATTPATATPAVVTTPPSAAMPAAATTQPDATTTQKPTAPPASTVSTPRPQPVATAAARTSVPRAEPTLPTHKEIDLRDPALEGR